MNHLWKILTSLRLTVLLLGFGIILVWVGTVAQADEGLYQAQARYFKHWFVPNISLFGHKLPAVLALTGHSDVATRRAALAAGCDHYLTKPVDPSVLARSIADLATGTLWRRKEARG